MARFFEGTSTGNRYEVGRSYEMNGSSYTAQADGSFRKEGNYAFTTDQGRDVYDNSGGRVLQGSAGNPDVNWYATGSDSLGTGWTSPGTAVTLTGAEGSKVTEAPQKSSGVSDGMVPMANPTLAARYAAASSGFARTAAWSGKDDPGQDNLLFGFHLQANPRTTNAELFEARYGDFGSSVIGIGVLADDLMWSAGRAFHNPANQKAMAGSAKDAGSTVITWGADLWDSARQAASNQVAWEKARDLDIAEQIGANDLRSMLEFEQARKYASGLSEDMSYQHMGFPGDWPGAQ